MGVAETLDKDLQEWTVAFLPQKMAEAAWVSGQKIMSPEGKQGDKENAPPPKWRSVIIIWLSLQMTVLPWAYTVGPMMHEAGFPVRLIFS